MTQSSERDTICAISTPPGVGGIAVIRVSGPSAIEIVDSIRKGGKPLIQRPSHTASLSTITDTTGAVLDEALVTIMRAPHSYTGDDTVEISVHGSTYIQKELLATLIKAGCRMAMPGEYTRRAYSARHIDLAQAEAVADIIASSSRAAHRLAINQMRGQFSARLAGLRQSLIELASLLELELDFSDQDVTFADRKQLTDLATQINIEVTRLAKSFSAGQAIKTGIPTAIVGPTNAGKSSLLNQLVGDDRAIVSDIHGTTRDTIEELLTIGSYTYRFIDTAGLRQTDDVIEQIGISRSRDAIARARIIIAMIDPTQPLDINLATLRDTVAAVTGSDGGSDGHSDMNDRPYLVVAVNKSDIAEADAALTDAIERETAAARQSNPGHVVSVTLSAATGHGLDKLTQTLDDIASADAAAYDGDILVTNARHAAALTAASQSTQRVIDGLHGNLSGDLIAQDLRQTIHHLADITGDIPATDILATIFSRFCIGK